MTTYNVTITSKMANLTVAGNAITTAETVQAAQKEANLQAALLSRQEQDHACDWKATITAV
jgi:hypothetical protein